MRSGSLLLIILISGLCLLLQPQLRAQTIEPPAGEQRLTHKTLKEVMTLIQELNMDIQLVYNDKIVSVYRDIIVDIRNKALSAVLREVLDQTKLLYTVQNNKIIISERSAEKS